LGAHTLGRAQRGNSGYEGAWVEGEGNRFDNRFYTLMLDKGVVWEKVVSFQKNKISSNWRHFSKLLSLPQIKNSGK
jgi:hypothetical protein